jgi:hypothetical protein
MTLTTISITHRDGVRRRYKIVLVPTLARVARSLFRRAPRLSGGQP